MSTTNPTFTPCTACQVDALHDSGVEFSDMDPAMVRSWSMWGCTCTPEATAEAVAWMDRVTR